MTDTAWRQGAEYWRQRAGANGHHAGQNGKTPPADASRTSREQPASDEPVVAGVRCSELGNGAVLADRLAGHFRHVSGSKQWMEYVDGRWQPDLRCRVHQEALRGILGLYERLGGVEDARDRKRLRDHLHRSESHRAVQAALAFAAVDARIATSEGDLDATPGLLNVRNGTIELATGSLRPHDPDDLLTKQAPVVFDELTEAPRFQQFLHTIMPDKPTQCWLQQFFGYLLCGDPKEQIVPIAYGEGQNGKSTLVDVTSGVLGPYALKADIETFLTQRHGGGGAAASPDLARMRGVRLVFASEPAAGRRLHVGRIKDVSGGESIVARRLYGEPFEFTPQFALWISTNKKPIVPGDDPALWRRLRLVPFTVTIPEERRILGLADVILADEASGVLNWMLEGLRAWQTAGRLPHVETITQATHDYRTESDEIGLFIAQCCQTGPTLRVSATDLYQAFTQWFAREMGGKAPSQTRFGRDLADRGFDSVRDGVTYRLGICLLPDHSPHGK